MIIGMFDRAILKKITGEPVSHTPAPARAAADEKPRQ